MSLSKKILKTVDLGTDLLYEVDSLKYLPYQMMWGSSLQGYNRKSIVAALSKLVHKGYVKKVKNEKQVYIALTKSGEEWLEKTDHKVSLHLNPTVNKWDGIYRFVLFDIPEKERVIRDTLRTALKRVGAVCWQKSVWVTKENITRELGDFIDSHGLEDYCTVLEVKDIYNPKLLKMLEKI